MYGVTTNYYCSAPGVRKDIRGILFQLVMGREVIMVLRHPDSCRMIHYVTHMARCTHIRTFQLHWIGPSTVALEGLAISHIGLHCMGNAIITEPIYPSVRLPLSYIIR